MEHPIYFIDAILSAIGLEHFAHNYSHMTHMWFVMLILIISAVLFGKGVKLLPKKGQNVVEVIVGGLENFMVEITGPEGRSFFPYIATTLLFYPCVQSDRACARLFFAHCQPEYYPGTGSLHICAHAHHRNKVPWD